MIWKASKIYQTFKNILNDQEERAMRHIGLTDPFNEVFIVLTSLFLEMQIRTRKVTKELEMKLCNKVESKGLKIETILAGRIL